MIITSYAQCPPNTRIVLSSGRIVHVISVVPYGGKLLVRLRNDVGQTRDVTADPGDLVLWATPDAEDMAAAALSRAFPSVEFLRRI